MTHNILLTSLDTRKDDSALQYSATYGDMRLHTGIDILCNTGTDIKSAADAALRYPLESQAAQYAMGRLSIIDSSLSKSRREKLV